MILLIACVPVPEEHTEHHMDKPKLASDYYSINLISHPALSVGNPVKLIFCIEEDGVPVTELDVTHEKTMHTMMLRKDTEHFAHLHPEFNVDCLEVEHTFEAAGAYNVFTEFSHKGQNYYQFFPIAVETEETPKANPYFEEEKHFGDYMVKFTTEPAEVKAGEQVEYTFHVKAATGEAVELQPYLGERMHSAVFGQQYFSHNHPAHTHDHDAHTDTSFMDTLPNPGMYAIFGEFKHNDVVTAAKFWIEVK